MSGPSSPASTEEQRRLAGRYVLRQPVGRGGAGVVWRAEDELLGRTVAIKECMLPPTVDDADREKLLTRVMREARTAARLDHPALVTVFDVVQESGRPWIVMEYVESRSLSQVVRQDGPLPAAKAVDIGLTLLDALRVAHSAGVLHRDVKPANVLITESGNVVLTDFGIAATTGDPTLTTSGMLLGSPSYMPPERARGEPATPDSDVWSLAATLYTLVEGTTPYSGDHPLAVLSAVAEHRRRPMELAGPLEPLLADILDSEPEQRPGELTVQRRLERIKSELAAQGPTTTGGTPIRSLGDFGEKSAAERTARLEAQRPSKDKQRHEPGQPVVAADGAGAAQAEPKVEDPAPAASDGPAAPEPESEAKPRRSLFGRRRMGSAAAGAEAAAAAAGGAAEANGHRDPAWDFDDFFAPNDVPGGQGQAADSELPSEPETSPVVESREPAAEAVAAPPEAEPDAEPEPVRPEPESAEAVAAPVEPAQSDPPQPEAPPADPVQAEPPQPAAAPAQSVDTRSEPVDDHAAPAAAAPALGRRDPAPASPREPADASASAASPQEDGRRNRRTPLLLGLGALVVVAIVALALVLGGGGSSKPKAVPGVPSSSGGAGTAGGNTGGSSSKGSGSSGSSGNSTQSAGPDASTGAAPPAGWQTYHDSQFGWTIAIPPGFTRSAGGDSRQVDFRDGQGRLMRVEINPHADPSAIGDWRTYEPSFARQVSNYQRIRMDPVDGGDGSRAADWEFTYSQGGSDLHVLNRGVVDGRTAHALYWQTPESAWDSSTQLRDQIFSTFQPPQQ